MKRLLFKVNLFEVLFKEMLVLCAFMTLAYVSAAIIDGDSIKEAVLWLVNDRDGRLLWEVMNAFVCGITVLIRVIYATVVTAYERHLYRR